MLALSCRLRTALFDLDPSAARSDVRGFDVAHPDKREILEGAGSQFIDGYRAAIRTADPARAVLACEQAPAERRGFAYEGAAMGLALLDLVTTGTPRRFRAFLDSCGDRHVYMAHVGAGWAIARCPWGGGTFLPKLEPLYRGLTVDGIGFHAAFFAPAAILRRRRRSLLRRLAPHAYDAGVGRALWFVTGADVGRAVRTLAMFDAERQPWIWSGVGLAVTYLGGASADELQALSRSAGRHQPYLALGAAFAAKARIRAGCTTAPCEAACRAFCILSAGTAAALTDECLAQVTSRDGAYEQWRVALVERLGAHAASAARAAGTSAG